MKHCDMSLFILSFRVLCVHTVFIIGQGLGAPSFVATNERQELDDHDEVDIPDLVPRTQSSVDIQTRHRQRSK